MVSSSSLVNQLRLLIRSDTLYTVSSNVVRGSGAQNWHNKLKKSWILRSLYETLISHCVHTFNNDVAEYSVFEITLC
jgi:hypothetical protein